MSTPPSYARPSHTIHTPRLILRSADPGDAKATSIIRSEPLNNPYGGVHEPDLPVEVQAQRIESQRASTARGENAWMNIILKPSLATHVEKDLVVGDGVFIGMTGFNSFPKLPSSSEPSREVLAGDTGAMIDYRYARNGYALEALEAIFEYGFAELGCEMMVLETYSVNAPWRRLMKKMGLDDVEKMKRKSDGEASGEVAYDFERAKWEESKKILKHSGKWYL